MNIEEAKSVRIVDFLARLGHHVEKPLNFDPFGHAELSLFAKI